MYGYFCNGFIDFNLKGKSLLEYSNLFSHTKSEKRQNNTEIFILDFGKVKRKNIYHIKCIVLNVTSIENLKTLRYQISSKRH